MLVLCGDTEILTLESKSCPVVLSGDRQKLLVYRRQGGGIELIAGNVKSGEFPANGGLRVLEFEAGLTGTVKRPLGVADSIVIGEIWYFFLCTAKVSEGGFSLLKRDPAEAELQPGWWALGDVPGNSWVPAHRRAFTFIRHSLGYEN